MENANEHEAALIGRSKRVGVGNAFVFIFSETNGHTFEIKYLPYPPTSKYWSSTNHNFEAGLQNIYAAEIIWKAVFSEYC